MIKGVVCLIFGGKDEEYIANILQRSKGEMQENNPIS